MAVTITRSVWIDDDGTGTTGTVINQALHTTLYNEIDTALAKVAQLAGGNAFTGTQSIAGVLTVTGFGTHSIGIGGGPGVQLVQIANPVAGTANAAQLTIGNDLGPVGSLAVFSSTFIPAGANVANGFTIGGNSTGGLSLMTASAAPIRLYTTSVERLRIAGTGELSINTTAVLSGAQVSLVTDLGAHVGVALQNTGAGNSGNFQLFINSAGGIAGNIAQSGATSVAYGTTSDARLKTDRGRAIDLAALRAVVVHDFTWTADGVRDRGVFAQDARDLFPRAVVEGTDDLTEGGDLARPWMIDYSKFVPDLIVGWQQHDAELAALRAAFATLSTAL